ncbi:hypothetical protein [Streptomyces phaeolivaceus]|uniref:hypothetical protein n=1 Tax=Streptomyces phaeolivaceus TaxID=2653200 RepID=UPI001D041F11|nr:hypothetical protein [Streptomyces phaeolivaceus]
MSTHMSTTDTADNAATTDNAATATVAATGWNAEALDEILANDDGRPVLFTNARILTMDPLIGTMTGADLLYVGSLLVGVGPGVITAAGDDNAIVVDRTGLTVAPPSWTPSRWPAAVAGARSTSPR